MLTQYRWPLVIFGVIFILSIVAFTQNGSFSITYHKIKIPLTSGEDYHTPSSPTLVTTTSHSLIFSPLPTIIPGHLNESAPDSMFPESSDKTDDKLSALRKLCRETQWTPGLWIHCHSTCGSHHTSVCGGLNNARNRIQTCLRYAIDAGAGLIIPSVTTRSETHLKDTDGGVKCASFFWDMAYLKSELQSSCPQLNLLFCDDRAGIETVVQAPHRSYLDSPHHPGSFAKVINSTLTRNKISPESMLTRPVIVNFGDSLMGWSWSRSDELFSIRKDLYKVLRHNPDLLDLSYRVLGHAKIKDGNFIGVHLRAENDWPDNFGSGADQMRLYKEEIECILINESSAVTTVYVSSGDAAVIEAFRRTLDPLGVTVCDKWTLLQGNDEMLERLASLSFDQKAIVEYETLVHSKYFLGPAMSSMSALIAYQRTLLREKDLFTTHIFPESIRNEETRWRTYPKVPAMLGDERTKLMVVNEFDIMDNFP